MQETTTTPAHGVRTILYLRRMWLETHSYHHLILFRVNGWLVAGVERDNRERTARKLGGASHVGGAGGEVLLKKPSPGTTHQIIVHGDPEGGG